MKIAQIAPIWLSIPPKKQGGTERIISSITEGLISKGHKVTLFATGDSATKAQLVSSFPTGIAEKGFPAGREFFLLPLIHMVKSLNLAKKFDVIHCHLTTLSDYILLALTKDFKNCLFTSHIVLPDKKHNFNRWQTLQIFNKIPFVSISNSQRALKLNFVATVYNGIDITKYKFTDHPLGKNKNDYIFWISRISPQKGILEAIEVSKRLNIELVFTKVTNAEADKKYFEKYVKPQLGAGITKPLPELNLPQKNSYFRNAKLFLFPIQWEEPFGLVMIESMATGTPVVAFARGSVPEVIKDGETGFIVNPSDDDIRGDWIVKKTGINGLCEAVKKIYTMSGEKYRRMRRACREHVEKNFTAKRMVNAYEQVYKRILKCS